MCRRWLHTLWYPIIPITVPLSRFVGRVFVCIWVFTYLCICLCCMCLYISIFLCLGQHLLHTLWYPIIPIILLIIFLDLYLLIFTFVYFCVSNYPNNLSPPSRFACCVFVYLPRAPTVPLGGCYGKKYFVENLLG